MQQFNVLKGTKGFVSLWQYALRLRDMITHKAQRKATILAFRDAHGIMATQDAFKVGRSTLYLWKQQLAEGKGKLEALNDKSTAPHGRRTRVVDPRIEAFIVRERREHPRLGKEKLAKLLEPYGSIWSIPIPASSTIGRIMGALKKAGKLSPAIRYSLMGKTGRMIAKKPRIHRKKVRRKGYQPEQAGDLVEVDTVVKFIHGIRRFIITAIDLKSDFAFAFAYPSLSSKAAEDFFEKLETVAPFTIKRIQTDNGLEFEKHFSVGMRSRSITHFHTYPRHPKMNAHVERFNRTIQEEFADWHGALLGGDVNGFNAKLMDWLLWYNTQRPHWSLNLETPMRVIVNHLSARESKSAWTDTGG